MVIENKENAMSTMLPDEMDRVIDEHFACEAAHDLEGVMTTFIDDAELDVVGFPEGPRRGKEQIRGFYEQLYKLLDLEEVRALHRYYGEDFMVDEVICTGHFADGALLGAEGYRGRVSFRLLHVLEFRDGRIARENVWLDSETARQQLLADGGEP
jgi:ketosteroid isomerase-like protein